MWAYHHRDQFADLDFLAIPTTVGRRLDVGGFVFTDSFDVFLRKLSEQYLLEAWSQLVPYLEYYQLNPQDLSWGTPHPGETEIAGSKDQNPEPHQFIGWISEELANFYREDKFALLDENLTRLKPQLRCIATWRSHKWKIEPTDFRMALRLIEALCTDELSEWSPITVLSTHKEINCPWLKIVKAINDENQTQLDLALQEAKTEYSPLGYRIVMLSTTALIQDGRENPKLRLPDSK